MILLCSILVVISMLVLMDCFKGQSGSHTNHAKLNLHWIFVIVSLFGRGKMKIDFKLTCIFMLTKRDFLR